MVIGSRGFIAWFEAVIYNKIRRACKNIFLKIFIHSIGVLLIMAGIYFLITTMPSMTSIAGLFLIFIGLFVFLIPLGVE
jgi:succinate-acetate transporter protein